MPRLFVEFLEGNNIYICRKCDTHLTNLSELISKAFRGQFGTAYLFNSAVNFREGQTEIKHLSTGVHQVRDIFCLICGDQTAIGWKYVKAMEPDQKYKEGKVILEQACLAKYSWISD